MSVSNQLKRAKDSFQVDVPQRGFAELGTMPPPEELSGESAHYLDTTVDLLHFFIWQMSTLQRLSVLISRPTARRNYEIDTSPSSSFAINIRELGSSLTRHFPGSNLLLLFRFLYSSTIVPNALSSSPDNSLARLQYSYLRRLP